MKRALEWVKSNHPECVTAFINFIGGDKTKIFDDFKDAGNCKIDNFYRTQALIGNFAKELLDLALKLIALIPSSAGLERAFSTMGFIHSDLRNKLGPEKVGKLAFCMRLLKDK